MATADQIAALRDRARADVGLKPKYARPHAPAKPEQPVQALAPGKPTAEDERAARLASLPEHGDGHGWHLEWAQSPFTGERFQYVVVERISPPWSGLDAMLIERGLRSAADLGVSRNLSSGDVSRPRSNERPQEEVDYAF